jgi:hypothetical protein
MSLSARSSARPMRRRRYVRPTLLAGLKPVFRHSDTRDAYVLRLVGNRYGPVLKSRRDEP